MAKYHDHYEKVLWSNGATALSAEHMNNLENGVSDLIEYKVEKESGKGLSTNDYTTAEKTKLSGIATGAEVNQNAFSNVKVGSTTIAADSKTDTLELVAGSNVTLTPDATNDKVTIASSYSNATTSAAGLMSAEDKTKLNSIASGANVNRTIATVSYELNSNVTIVGHSLSGLTFKGNSTSYEYRVYDSILLATTSNSVAEVCISSHTIGPLEATVYVYNPKDQSITISKDNSYVRVVCIGA